MALGCAAWREARARIQALLSGASLDLSNNEALRARSVVDLAKHYKIRLSRAGLAIGRTGQPPRAATF